MIITSLDEPQPQVFKPYIYQTILRYPCMVVYIRV